VGRGLDPCGIAGREVGGLLTPGPDVPETSDEDSDGRRTSIRGDTRPDEISSTVSKTVGFVEVVAPVVALRTNDGAGGTPRPEISVSADRFVLTGTSKMTFFAGVVAAVLENMSSAVGLALEEGLSYSNCTV